MLLLATDAPEVQQDESGRMIVTVPNGKAEIEIAMTVNEALAFGVRLARAVGAVIDHSRGVESAAVIDFTPRKRRAK